MTSAAPGTFSTKVATSLALSYNSCVSSPYSLMAISAFAPVISSLKRSCIGCEKLNSARSESGASASFILSTISARLPALVHSLNGFMIIITSASSTAIGSVGTSAVPILATTCLISGNLSINAFSAKRETSILSVSELPAGSVICMAKSPSSKVGMNSAPRRVKRKSEPISAEKAMMTVRHL